MKKEYSKITNCLKTLAVLASLFFLIGIEANAQTSKCNFNVEEKTISELQKAMEDETVSSLELVECYIARIKKYDSKLNSVLEINPDARNIAKERDKERKAKKVRSSMHGIPVLLKDNIDTKDKMKTTAGSLALLNAPTPKNDAYIVTQLRNAGAVILGKTNMTEWAGGRSGKVPQGWSLLGGQTRSPYYFNLSPNGSSSGSAVATSANFTIVAVGTETTFSIVGPASVNGIVGIKPTMGLISRKGIIPLQLSFDTAGSMSRNVTDAAILLRTMICGAGEWNPKRCHDNKEREMSRNKSKRAKVYKSLKKEKLGKLLQKDGLSGANIGFINSYKLGNTKMYICDDYGHVRLISECKRIIKKLRKLNAKVKEVTLPDIPIDEDDRNKNIKKYRSLLDYEKRRFLSKYLNERGWRKDSSRHPLEELIHYHKSFSNRVYAKWFDTKSFKKALLSNNISDSQYEKQLVYNRELVQVSFNDAMMDGKQKFDVLILPTSYIADRFDTDENGEIRGSVLSRLDEAGYPHITVPGGTIEGLPFGISFIGRPYSEPLLIKLAYAWEQKTKCRIVPEFKKEYPKDKPKVTSVASTCSNF